MGALDDTSSFGGGVGLIHAVAGRYGFDRISLMSSEGFRFRPAPAEYLLFSWGGHGAESQVMMESSPVLVILGGGLQALLEATAYLQFNPNGFLLIINDPTIEGSAQKLVTDNRFVEFAHAHPDRVAIVGTGTEAGAAIAERLNLVDASSPKGRTIAQTTNIFRPGTDLRVMLPFRPVVVGFSGWSVFGKGNSHLLDRQHEIVGAIELAVLRLNSVFTRNPENRLLYVTAGNNHPTDGVAPFETLVHRLPLPEQVRLGAVTANEVNIEELDPNLWFVSFIADTWRTRVTGLVSYLDILVTSGGGTVVKQQAEMMAQLGRPHIHISGAGTMSDLHMEALATDHPKMKILSPEEILGMSDEALLELVEFNSFVE